MTSIATEPVTHGSERLARLIAAIGEGALERERTGERPFEAINLIREERLGALRVPSVDGGGGASLRELFDVLIQLAAADVNVAHILRGHFAFVEGAVRAEGEQRRRNIDLALSGAIVGNASTELTSARPGTYQYQTVLTRDGDGYRLNGTKYFTTGTLYADYTEVEASDEDGGLVIALVPTDREGVQVIDDWDGMGQRATGSGTTIFTNVAVHADEVQRFPSPLNSDAEPMYRAGAMFQLYITALIAGVLHSLRDDAVAHVHQRARSFAWAPDPIPADDPLLQREIGEIASAAYAARATVLAAADAIQRAQDAAIAGNDLDFELAHQASLAAASAKVIVDKLGQKAASQVFDVGGASVARQAHLLDRHWRNIRTLASHNPTSYKAQAIGAFYTRETRLPGSGYF